MTPTLSVTPRGRLVLGLAAAVAAAVLWVRLIAQPALGRISARRATLTALEAQIAHARELADRLPEVEAASRQAHGRYDALARRLESVRTTSHVLEMLSHQAKAHRLELIAVEPRQPTDGPHRLSESSGLVIHQIPMWFKLAGRYRQVGEFLGELTEGPVAAAIRELRLTKAQAEGAVLKVDLVLAVYLAEEQSALPGGQTGP
jgi:Tfp pilus assembly protein PilO